MACNASAPCATASRSFHSLNRQPSLLRDFIAQFYQLNCQSTKPKKNFSNFCHAQKIIVIIHYCPVNFKKIPCFAAE